MPSAIATCRASIAFMIGGQMNFIVNHTKTNIAIVWPISVRLKSTNVLLAYRSRSKLRRAGASAADQGVLQLTDERIGECEEQRDTDADHRDRVEQRDDEEHLRAQHRCKLRLACSTLEETAAEQAHADADAEGAEADQNRHRDCGHANHNFHQSLQSRLVVHQKKKGSAS